MPKIRVLSCFNWAKCIQQRSGSVQFPYERPKATQYEIKQMNNLSTLRVEGAEQPVYALLANLQEAAVVEQVTGKWKKGDPYIFRGRNKYQQSSGFIATIHDDASPAELIVALRKFLQNCEKYEICFAKPDLSVQLSIGVIVGDSEQFWTFLDFEPSDLALLGKLGIHLSIACYPAADSDNDDAESKTRRSLTTSQEIKKWKQEIKSMSARQKAFFKMVYEDTILNAPTESSESDNA